MAEYCLLKGGRGLGFEWLTDYRKLEEHIHYLEWNLNKSKLELKRWVIGDLVNVRLNKNSRSSSLEENIQKIEDELKILNNQKKEMLELISNFEGVDNQIVKLKYIDGITLENIAEEIGYSVSYVRQRHASIKKTLDFVNKYEKNTLKEVNKVREKE